MYNVRDMDFDEAWQTLTTVFHEYKPLEYVKWLMIWQDVKESKEFYIRTKQYFIEAARPIRNIMEIGGHIGGHISLLSTLIDVDDGIAIVIEPEINNTFLRRVVMEAIKPIKLIHLPLYSQDEVAVKLVGKLVECYGSIDVLIIDGNHSEPITTADFHNYYDMVSSPGVIMFHDITEPSMGLVFDKLTSDYKAERIELAGAYRVYGIGMVYK